MCQYLLWNYTSTKIQCTLILIYPMGQIHQSTFTLSNSFNFIWWPHQISATSIHWFSFYFYASTCIHHISFHCLGQICRLWFMPFVSTIFIHHLSFHVVGSYSSMLFLDRLCNELLLVWYVYFCNTNLPTKLWTYLPSSLYEPTPYVPTLLLFFPTSNCLQNP